MAGEIDGAMSVAAAADAAIEGQPGERKRQKSEVEVVTMSTGHLGPYESPLQWRKHVLTFFDK